VASAPGADDEEDHIPSLRSFRRCAAPLLGVFETGVCDVGADATTGQLACTSALGSGARFKSSVLPASYFRGKWLHRPDAVNRGPAPAADDRDRLIASYTPADGFLTPDDAWAAAPDGEVFEITSLFSGADLNALVNEALKRLWVVVEVTLSSPISSNVRLHDLTTDCPFLTNPRWIYQVGHLESTEDRVGTTTLAYTNPFDRPQTGRAYSRLGRVVLEGPSWTTTQTPYVLLVAPADALCTPTGGDFGDQTGLALEDDEAPVDERWLAWRVILEAADRLDYFEKTASATQEALRSRQMAATRFQALTRANLVVPERTFTPPRINISPTVGAGWGRA